MTDTLITNASLVLPDRIMDPAWLAFDNGIFTAMGQGDSPHSATTIIDAQGAFIFPGLIDLQINGGGGKDFIASENKLAVDDIINANQETGTTALLATLIVERFDILLEKIRLLADTAHDNLLGIHVEGPFFNPDFRGMHDPENILLPTIEKAKALVTAGQGKIKIITLAPDLPNALDVIAFLSAQNIIVSLGHSGATADQTKAALDAGASMGTHLFNRMSPLHHHFDRAGMVPALLNSSAASGLIADGMHINDDVLKMILRIKDTKLFFVSDGNQALGTKDKSFIYKGETITVRDGTCFNENGIMAGSATPLFKGVINAHRLGFPLHDMVRMASLVPAEIIGAADRIGSLSVGKQADFLVVDRDNLTLQAVYKAGQKFNRVFNV